MEGKRMNGMGYHNAQAVYRLSREGRLNKTTESKTTDDKISTLDSLALHMLVYMALSSVDPEDTEGCRKYPARCYWAGWDAMVEDFGMALPSKEQAIKSLKGEISLEEYLAKRRKNARTTLSKKAKWLTEQGLIKCIRPSNTFLGRNATWVLLLGDDEENARIIAAAKRKFKIKEKN